MKEGLIEIVPKKLVFKYSDTEVSPLELEIINNSADDILFKIKVTSPKDYFVKPSQGKIPSKEEIKITIKIRGESATQFPPLIDGHKFSVWYTRVSKELNNTTLVWEDPNIQIYSEIIQVTCKEQSEPIQERFNPIQTISEPIQEHNTEYKDKHMNTALEIEYV